MARTAPSTARAQLSDIFNSLRELLRRYEGRLTPKLNLTNKYDLWSIKQITIAGRERSEVYFAGLVIQKDYVGFYFMPVYVNPKLAGVFHPDLLKLLKGKSCFHVRKLDPALRRHIVSALRRGYALYAERGWV